MSFFSLNINRQKSNAKLQTIKSVLLNAYVLTKNFQMLSIINQIDQLIIDKSEIIKINSNVEILTIQQKLDVIIKKLKKIENFNINFNSSAITKLKKNENFLKTNKQSQSTIFIIAFTASSKSAIITAVKSIIINQIFFSNINQIFFLNISQKVFQNN